MNDPIPTEVLPPEAKDTAITLAIPERDALPPSLLANIETAFVGFFTEAEKWRRATGQVRGATIVGPLDWAAISTVAAALPFEVPGSALGASYQDVTALFAASGARRRAGISEASAICCETSWCAAS